MKEKNFILSIDLGLQTKNNLYDKLFLIVFIVVGFIFNGFLNSYSHLLYFTILSFLYFSLVNTGIKSDVILIYSFCVFLSWALSSYFPDPYNLLTDLLSIAFMIYALNKRDDISFLNFLRTLFYFSSFLVFLNHILSKYLNISFLFTSRNQNYEAFFYLIAFSFLIKERINFIRAIFLLSLTITIFLIKSRVGLFSIILLLFIKIYKSKDKSKKLFIIFLILLVFLIAINYSDVLKFGDPKSYKRLDMYLSSIEAFLANPFTGWGIGSFNYVFEIFKFSYYDGVGFYGHLLMHSHSHLLNILVEGGIINAFFVFMILYSVFKNGFDFTVIGALPFFIFDSILINPFIKTLFFFFIGLNLKEDSYIIIEVKKILPILLVFFISAINLKDDNDFRKYNNSYKEIAKTENRFRRYAIAEYSYFYNPKNVVFLYIYSYSKGNRKELLEKIVSLEPNFTQAYLELCEIYAKSRDKRFHECISNLRLSQNCNRDDIYSFFLCNYNKKLYNSLKSNLNNY